MLLPTPLIARRAAQLARAYDCDTVWFGAAAPLGLLAAGLRRRADIRRVVAQTHGHEVGGPRCRPPARRCAVSVGAWTSPPISASTPVAGWPACWTG
ncbi:hypothetical protein NKG94_47110 [Micromonospora sp. M12]